MTFRCTTAAARRSQHLSLEVEEGEFVGLVGHNGAGKSTTLWTITGVLRPSSGDVLFQGRSIVGRAPDAILRLGISLVPENRRIFGRLTVGENLRIGTSARTDRRAAEADIKKMCERFPALGSYFDRSGSQLSGGEQQQLAIARALLARPRLLLLDEPTLGLAPLLVDRVFEILQELKRGGRDDPARRAERCAHDRARRPDYVMRVGGRIEFHGTADELARIGDFETAYIGLGPGRATVTQILQYTVDSISYGSLYALMALSLALLFGVMRLINFAYGELIMAGAYTMYYTRGYGWLAMIAITVVAVTVLSLLMERMAFRPVRNARRSRC